MKKINLILKTDDKLISDNIYSYKDEDSFKVIDYDGITLKLKLDEDFIFVRETNDDIFKIENNQGLITLKDINQSFDIDLSKCEYLKEDDTHYITYSIDGDGSLIEIIIKEQ